MTGAIYLDTNLFIKAFETEDTISDCAWTVPDAVTRGDVLAMTSELRLAELLPNPMRLGSELLVEIYTGLIQTGGALSVTHVTRSILVKSAQIRAADRTVRLPDAIHIATALDTGCIAFVSDDRRLRLPTSLPVIRLGPDSLANIKALAS
jgi:predicted nucleic acid-binding protein